jgi:aminoglycoside 2'-N-acetyltransferase I
VTRAPLVVSTTAGPVPEPDELRSLLDAAFAGDFTDDDWDHALGGTHVVAHRDGRLVGHAAVVARTLEAGGRSWRTGYVEAVAVRPDLQGAGIGTAVMTRVGELVVAGFELGGLATARPGFYHRLGWRTWEGPTSARTPGGGAVRTPDDDGAVLVLTVGPSARLALTGPISCAARVGDHW